MSPSLDRRRLDRFFEPTRIAIVGATNAPHPSYNALENLRLLHYEGAIDLVNPKYQELHDLPCYPSVSSLPIAPDAVLITVPARFVPGVIAECVDRQVLGATIFTAGFRESGPEGAALEDQVVAMAQRGRMVITGPNGMGWLNINARTGLYAGSLPREFRPGNVAVVSQSGSGLIALLHAGRQLSLGFVMSGGNEAAVDTADYIGWLADQADIDVILLFLETVRRGNAFVEALERAREAGKTLIALKTGRSETGRLATLAHTGALAGSDIAYDAVFRRFGVHRAQTLDEMIEMGVLFSIERSTPAARGLGLITVSGGLMGLYADLVEPLGLTFPPLSEETSASLAELFGDSVKPSNPLDAGAGVYSPERYTRCIELVANDPGIGLLAVAQDAPPGMGPTQTERYRRVLSAICQATQRVSTPVVLFTSTHGGIEHSLWAELRQQTFPILFGAAESLRAIRAYLQQPGPGPRRRDAVLEATGPKSEARAILACADGGTLSERHGKALVRLYGIKTSEPQLVTSREQVRELAVRVGFPLVAKIESPDISHKARVGGVQLGVRSAAEAAEAYDEIIAAVRRHHPDARVNGVILEREAPPGLEILVGHWQDPTFGPLILLGLGGVYAEAVSGQVAALVPLQRGEAEKLAMSSPVGRALARTGHPPEAVFRLAELLVNLSRLIDDLRDEVAEIDLNPIRLMALDGVPVVLDTLVVLRTPRRD